MVETQGPSLITQILCVRCLKHIAQRAVKHCHASRCATGPDSGRVAFGITFQFLGRSSNVRNWIFEYRNSHVDLVVLTICS